MLFQLYSCGWGGVLLTLVTLGCSGRAEGRGDWPGRGRCWGWTGVTTFSHSVTLEQSSVQLLHVPQSCVQARLFGDLWSRHRLLRAGLAAVLTCWRNRALACPDRIFLVTANSLQGLSTVSWLGTLALQIQWGRDIEFCSPLARNLVLCSLGQRQRSLSVPEWWPGLRCFVHVAVREGCAGSNLAVYDILRSSKNLFLTFWDGEVQSRVSAEASISNLQRVSSCCVLTWSKGKASSLRTL